uniref:Uncharacterized protein n=1 Tax=Salmonella enterica subsp. enterica serovar London TaxID=149390 RepID=A0A3G8EVR7_SALET|nr:hypothetical protein KADIGFNM_00229 [Salmonella enterica subsp. enterica serovar London]AZF85733.1 hypothetical protein KADIGFNM_00396 [Salmonella enterica subsp. enterica serovar London]
MTQSAPAPVDKLHDEEDRHQAATTVMPRPTGTKRAVESLPRNGRVRLCATPAKGNSPSEIEAVQGCRGEERSVGGETAHQPTEHSPATIPNPKQALMKPKCARAHRHQ